MMKPHSRIREKLFYGWWVVLAFFMITIVAFGARFSFGVFFKPLASEFGLTRTETSGIYSAYMLLCCLFAIVSGWGADKFSPRILFSLMGLFLGLSLILTSRTQSLRQLFIAYSFFLAVGTGGVYGVSVSTIIRWFDRRRGLAIGLTTSGVGLGTVMMAPFATYLIANVGWRSSLILIGIISWLFIIPMAMLLKKDPREMGLLPYGVESSGGKTGGSHLRVSSSPATGLSLWHAFKTRNFWCLGFSWILTPLCLYMAVTHIVPHVTDMGIPAMNAATILSLIGAMNIPGRLVVGNISDNAGRKVTAMICALFLAGAVIWLIYLKDLWMFYIFAAVFGFFFGGISTSTTAMAGDLFGLHSIGVIMGTLSACWALGAAIGPFIGGLVYDMWRNYSVAFSISAAAMMIATLLLALTKRETKLDR